MKVLLSFYTKTCFDSYMNLVFLNNGHITYTFIARHFVQRLNLKCSLEAQFFSSEILLQTFIFLLIYLAIMYYCIF